MPTQTGSIDLKATNGVKLYAKAGFDNADGKFATKSELEVQSDRIGMVVANSDASSNLQLTAGAMEYIGDHVEIKGTDGTSTVISGGKIQANSLTIGAMTTDTQADILNSNIIGGGENLIGRFNYKLSHSCVYDYLSGTITSTTTTNTRNNSVYVQFYTGTTTSSVGTFVRQLDAIGSSANVGQLLHATFEKSSDYTHMRLKFNGDKADSGVFWDVSSIADGTELTLSFTLESISSDGKGNGGVLSGINLRTGNMPSRWSLAPQDQDVRTGGRNYAKTDFERFPIGTSQTRQSGVTATIAGPSTFTLNGTATTTDWFFSAAGVFGGLVLQEGAYKVWCTSPNVNIRVGIGSGGNTWFVGRASCTKDNPLNLNITTEQAYYFTPYSDVGKSFSNQEVRLMVELSDHPTDWTPAPEDQTFYVDDSVSSIQVGGRNLLKESIIKTYDTSANKGVLDTSSYVSSGTITYSRGAVQNMGFYVSQYVLMEASTNYVISFRAKVTSGSITKLYVYSANPNNVASNTVYMNGNKLGAFNTLLNVSMTNGTYYDFRLEFTTNASIATGTYTGQIIQWNKDVSTAFSVEMDNLKWEKGNKATDWTPAPEDVEAGISDAAKTATNYIEQDSTGIKIRMTGNTSTYQHQSATGTKFYVDGAKRSEVGASGLKVYVGSAGSETPVASFGEQVVLGTPFDGYNSGNCVTIDSGGMKVFGLHGYEAMSIEATAVNTIMKLAGGLASIKTFITSGSTGEGRTLFLQNGSMETGESDSYTHINDVVSARHWSTDESKFDTAGLHTAVYDGGTSPFAALRVHSGDSSNGNDVDLRLTASSSGTGLELDGTGCYMTHGNVGQTINATKNAVTTYPSSGYLSYGHDYGTSIPDVVVGFNSNSTAAGFGGLSISVSERTATGFKVKIFNNTTTDRSPGFYWIAMG